MADPAREARQPLPGDQLPHVPEEALRGSEGGKTNAQRLLETAGVAHRVVSYEVDESDLSAAAVSGKTGIPLERLWKTLALRSEGGEVVLCCLPGDAELDLKKAARALGARRVSLLPLRELEAETGYVRGGCSPLGSRRRLRVLLDEVAQLSEEISVSAGRRGLQLLLAPDDLLRLSGGVYADLT